MAFIRNVTQKPEGLSYGDILDRFVLLEKVEGLTGDKLCFARRKNLMKLRSFEKMNSMGSRIPVSDEFRRYMEELTSLRARYLLTDKDGKTVMKELALPGGKAELQPVVDIANPILQEETDTLNLKYVKAIREREDDLKAYREFLAEMVPDIELPEIHTIHISEVSGINQQQADAIAWFIEE